MHQPDRADVSASTAAARVRTPAARIQRAELSRLLDRTRILLHERSERAARDAERLRRPNAP